MAYMLFEAVQPSTGGLSDGRLKNCCVKRILMAVCAEFVQIVFTAIRSSLIS